MAYDHDPNPLRIIDGLLLGDPPSIVTRIRRCPDNDPVAYAVGLRLHACLNLDTLLSDIDLTTLTHRELRSLLGGIRKATGIGGGTEFNATPEDGD